MAPAHHQNQQLLMAASSPSSSPSNTRTVSHCLDSVVTRTVINSSSTVASAVTTKTMMPPASSPMHRLPSPASSSSSSSSPASSPMISKSASTDSSPSAAVSLRNGTSVLAKVTAQVMSRSEKFGGWLPHSGGGMSNIMLIRRSVNGSDRTSGIRSTSSASSASSDITSATGYRSTGSTSAVSIESATTSPTPPSSSSSSPVVVSESLSDFDSHEPLEDEFQIIGTRISDEIVVLDCLIKKDIVYNNVMPTFHYWITGNTKFGLTFVTSTEGRKFDQAMREVICDIHVNDCPLRS